MSDEQDFIRNELRITCADAVELVTEFLDDALDEGDRDAFTTHLSLCEGCQVFLDQMRSVVRLSSHGRDTDIEVVPADMDALLAALGERSEPAGPGADGIGSTGP